MPNFDGTGPEGNGPKTGRQMGKCGGKKSSNTENTEASEKEEVVYGRGRGGRPWGGGGAGGGRRGRGFGRGRGRGQGFGGGQGGGFGAGQQSNDEPKNTEE